MAALRSLVDDSGAWSPAIKAKPAPVAALPSARSAFADWTIDYVGQGSAAPQWAASPDQGVGFAPSSSLSTQLQDGTAIDGALVTAPSSWWQSFGYSGATKLQTPEGDVQLDSGVADYLNRTGYSIRQSPWSPSNDAVLQAFDASGNPVGDQLKLKGDNGSAFGIAFGAVAALAAWAVAGVAAAGGGAAEAGAGASDLAAFSPELTQTAYSGAGAWSAVAPAAIDAAPAIVDGAADLSPELTQTAYSGAPGGWSAAAPAASLPSAASSAPSWSLPSLGQVASTVGNVGKIVGAVSTIGSAIGGSSSSSSGRVAPRPITTTAASGVPTWLLVGLAVAAVVALHKG